MQLHAELGLVSSISPRIVNISFHTCKSALQKKPSSWWAPTKFFHEHQLHPNGLYLWRNAEVCCISFSALTIQGPLRSCPRQGQIWQNAGFLAHVFTVSWFQYFLTPWGVTLFALICRNLEPWKEFDVPLVPTCNQLRGARFLFSQWIHILRLSLNWNILLSAEDKILEVQRCQILICACSSGNRQ